MKNSTTNSWKLRRLPTFLNLCKLPNKSCNAKFLTFHTKPRPKKRRRLKKKLLQRINLKAKTAEASTLNWTAPSETSACSDTSIGALSAFIATSTWLIWPLCPLKRTWLRKARNCLLNRLVAYPSLLKWPLRLHNSSLRAQLLLREKTSSRRFCWAPFQKESPQKTALRALKQPNLISQASFLKQTNRAENKKVYSHGLKRQISSLEYLLKPRKPT